jgi:ParB/RepB/Spo0J family partition protein
MTDAKLENVPLECIRVSPTNPRKHFNEAQLAELAESIKQQGVAQPILVRPIPKDERAAPPLHFEIVAGERRYRASKLAGMPSIPAIVRELDDAQALEIQVVENLQRADLHPLEEAEGYELLMKLHKYSAEQLADKVGKSKAYIYGRLKLCALEPDARKAFYAGKLTSSTALLVARIPVKQLQARAVGELTKSRFHGSDAVMSTREAQEHIHRNYMLALGSAPFQTTDAKLIPKAGACVTCPKRTGNQPELFADVDSADVCTDPDCYGRKRDAWAVIRIVQAKAAGQVVIEGKEAAKVFQYGNHPTNGFENLTEKNYNDPKQRTWKQLAKAAGVLPVLVKNPNNGDLVELLRVEDLKPHLKELGLITRTGANPGNATVNEEARRAKAETVFRQRVFAEIRAAAAGKMQREDWVEVAIRMLCRVESNDFKRLMGILEWERDLSAWNDRDGRLRAHVVALSPNALSELLRDCALIGETVAGTYSTGKPERLLEAANRYGVDVAAIKAELKAPAKQKKAAVTKGVKAKAAPPVPVPTSAEAAARHAQRIEAWPFPTGAAP